MKDSIVAVLLVLCLAVAASAASPPSEWQRVEYFPLVNYASAPVCKDGVCTLPSKQQATTNVHAGHVGHRLFHGRLSHARPVRGVLSRLAGLRLLRGCRCN